MNSIEKDRDYKADYEEFWKDLVEVDGKIDKDKVMRELSDYRFMLEQVPKVYDHVSGGRISKPNTYAFEVIGQHDTQRQEDINEAISEYLEDHDLPKMEA